MNAALTCALVAVVSAGGAVPLPDKLPTFVRTERSQVSEPMDDFAVRIQPTVVDEAMRISSELCGEIRRDGDAFVLDLYTIRGLRECSYRRFAAHDYTGLTYHTHILTGETDWHRIRAKQMNPRFSEDDYAHPGYLATERKVLFQNGRGTQRRVRAGSNRGDATDDRSIANRP